MSSATTLSRWLQTPTLDGEQMCVLWHEALCLCSLGGEVLKLCVGSWRERDFISVIDLSTYFDVFRPRRRDPPACSPPSLSVSADGSRCAEGEVTSYARPLHVAFWEMPPPKCVSAPECLLPDFCSFSSFVINKLIIILCKNRNIHLKLNWALF